MFNELVINSVQNINSILVFLWKRFACLTTKSLYQKTETFTTKFSLYFTVTAVEHPMCSYDSKLETIAPKTNFKKIVQYINCSFYDMKS